MGRGIGVVTVKVIVLTDVPDKFVAVNIYLVVDMGDTLLLPDAETEPILLIFTLVAPLTDQLSVAELPLTTDVGETEKLFIVGRVG